MRIEEMSDDILEVMETVYDGKNYVIAQSLKEQKRANDLKEIELKQRREWHLILSGIFIIIGLLIVYLIYWLHINSIPTRILG